MSRSYDNQKSARTALPSITANIKKARAINGISADKIYLYGLPLTKHRDYNFNKQGTINRINVLKSYIKNKIVNAEEDPGLPFVREDGTGIDGNIKPINYTIQKYTHVVSIAAIVHKRLEGIAGYSGNITARELYYEMFSALTTEITEALLTDAASILAFHLQIPVRSLGITKEPRGKVAGRVYLDCGDDCGEDGILDCRKVQLQGFGYDITEIFANSFFGMNDPNFAPVLLSDARFLLVIEAGGVFKRFVDARIWEEYPVVLVCTHGRMEHNTNVFIHHMIKAFDMEVQAIVDGDFGGLTVLNNSYFAYDRNRLCRFEGLFCGIETNLLGILAQEYEALGVANKTSEKAKMNDEYLKRIEDIEKDLLYDHGNVETKKKHVQKMKNRGYKQSVESVESTVFMTDCRKKIDAIMSVLKKKEMEYETEDEPVLSSEQKMRLILSKSFFPVNNWQPESDDDKEHLALLIKIKHTKRVTLK